MLDPVFEKSDLELELNDKGEAPSDNTSFFHGGIPALFFFTNVHADYHMPGDDADKINYEGEVRVLNLVNEVIKTLDSAPSLEFVKYGGMGMPADFDTRMREHYRHIAERRVMKGKLGIRADVAGEMLTLSKVTVDSAASESGLMVGDVLLQVNGRDITTTVNL